MANCTSTRHPPCHVDFCNCDNECERTGGHCTTPQVDLSATPLPIVLRHVEPAPRAAAPLSKVKIVSDRGVGVGTTVTVDGVEQQRLSRLELKIGMEEVTSLVLRHEGPKRREWGFATERGWIPNHRYLDEFPLRAEWRDQPVVSR